MKKTLLFLTGLIFLLICMNPQVSYATNGPGIYVGSALPEYGDNAVNELRQSGFKWLCVWTIHIGEDGNMNFNGHFPLVENGVYVGNSTYPNFANNMASLKVAPTSIEWVEMGLSAWQSGTFDAIKNLVNSEGTGPGSTLYENFKALRDAVPAIDAFSFDDESTYHEPSSTQFAIMLADLGFKVSVCPYTQVSHWQNVVANTNAARPGTIEDVHLQCYAGGAGNNPCTWDGYFAPEINVMPGVEPGSVASKMANWNNQCGITGGWIWAYDSYYGQTSVVQGWATDIANNISGGTPPPPTANNVAPDATVTVSSEYPDAAYSKEKLTDGIRNQHGNGEWASNGETTPWAQLNWNQSVKTSKVILYDRPNTSDHVASGTLTFSDGSSVSVGSLPNEGAAQEVTFSERTITWVKFQVNSGDGPNNGLAEFEVVGEYTSTPPPAETNIALNKPVTASSIYGTGYEASKAVDGNVSSTRWASAVGSAEWIYVDLQNTYSISQVVLKWQDAYGKDFTIQVSDDASSWTTIKTVTNNTSLTNDLTGLSATGRYVRMNGTAYGPYTLYSLWEFEVYGSGGTTPPPTESNLAPDATISVSSEYPDAAYSKEKMVDGIKAQHGSGEWASNGEETPWAQLDWSQDVVTSKVILYDRPNQYDHIASGTLTFSDGSSVSVGSLANDGSAETITFSERTVTWVKLEVTSGDGPNNGLAEFEVIGHYDNLKSAADKEDSDALTEIKVYPNPATDVFTVESPEMSMTRLTIFDMQGRLVYQNEFEGRIQISTDEISGSGILFIKLASETNTYIQRIVIE